MTKTHRTSFREYLQEAGEAAGKMEIVKTPEKDAAEYADRLWQKEGVTLNDEMPDFETNYNKCQKLAMLGHTKRKDMPVIDDKDIALLVKRLEVGALDVTSPHPKNTPEFKQHLKGKEAELFLRNGTKARDGDAQDDKTTVKMKQMSVGDLKPIQQQIYFDKSIQATVEFGIQGTKKFLKSSVLVASNDGRIIDGHHRWLSANLIDPDMKVKVLVIDLPIEKLLNLTIAYGDAIGNSRNK